MPSQQEVRWSQLKIGVIVLAASVILVTLLFLMTSAAGLGVLSRKLTISTYFENSAGLKEGAAVNLQGVTIGTVKSVTVTTAPERKLTPVKVVMKLNEKFASSLKKDSKASLTTIGVLGDTVVDINSQFATGPPLQDGDELKTLENQLDQTLLTERLIALLSAGFGFLATLLAAIGLYGVMSYAVSQSTRELGLRMAVGARPLDLFRLVISRGLVMTVGGIFLGAAAALELTRLIGDLLYRVNPRDPIAFGSAFLAMAIISSAACFLPAWRATRIDPVRALRD